MNKEKYGKILQIYRDADSAAYAALKEGCCTFGEVESEFMKYPCEDDEIRERLRRKVNLEKGRARLT